MAAESSLEDHIVRFRDLGERRSAYRPLDMLLERFERERYPVVGRGAETAGKGGRTAEVEGFSIVYLRIEPGKGIGAHAHDTAEVFIPLSGRWQATVDGQEALLEAWDVISVPPNRMHGLVNIGAEVAFVLTVNAGQAGAPIYFAPALLDEVRAAGGPVRDIDYPPGASPGP